jgi:O-antigen ligase
MSSGVGRLDSNAGSNSISNLNNVYIYILTCVVFLAPIPLGSNRPVFWMFWASIIALLLAAYLAFAGLERVKTRLKGLWPLIGVASLIPIFGIIQILPLSLNQFELQATGVAITENTISIAPHVTTLAIIRITSLILLFTIVAIVITRNSSAIRFVKYIFYGITAHAVFSLLSTTILSIYFQNDSANPGAALTGFFVNRNSFASFLGMGVILGIGLAYDVGQQPIMRTPHRKRYFSPQNLSRLALSFCTLLVMIALVATESRAGLIGTLIGVAVTITVMLRTARTGQPEQAKNKKNYKIAIAFGALLLMLIIFLGQSVIERGIYTIADAENRIFIYETTLELVRQRPIFGYGLDTFELAFETGRRNAEFNDDIFTDAHNSYLESWINLGIIFGSAIFILGIVHLQRLLKLKSGANHPKAISAIAFGLLTLAIIHSLFDFSFEIMANSMILVALLATTVANTRSRNLKR